jgi:hypothetical protein
MVPGMTALSTEKSLIFPSFDAAITEIWKMRGAVASVRQ